MNHRPEDEHEAESTHVAPWAAVLTGLVVFIVSALGASPGIAALDAGDFVTASAELGVPHATGFPIQVMLGHVFTLIPFGSIAFRVALVSSAASGLAAGFLTLAVGRFAGRSDVAVVAGVAVTVAFCRVPTLMLHARVPEVYALNLALVCVALLVTERMRRAELEDWVLLGGVLGLGLASHATFRMYAPIFIGAALALDRARSPRRVCGLVIAAAVTALMAYAYVFVAARSMPEHNWGRAVSLSAWWAHINASEIQDTYDSEMFPSVYVLMCNGAELWSQVRALAPLLLVGGLASLGFVFASARWVALLTLLVAAEMVYSLAINPMGIVDHQNGQLAVILLSALAAWAVTRLVARVAGHRPTASTALASTLIALGGLTLTQSSDFGRVGDDRSIEDLVVTAAGLAPPEAVISWSYDSTSGGSLYVHRVLDARPDVLAVERYLFSRPEELADHLQRSGEPELADRVRNMAATGAEAAGRAMLMVLALDGQGRTVLWETSGLDAELPSLYALEHRWPIGVVSPVRQQGDECVPGDRSYCLAVDPPWAGDARFERGATGFPYRRWLATQWGYRAGRLVGRGDFVAAGAAFERAAQLAPEVSAWRVSVAVCLASVGRVEEALELCEDVAIDDPLNARAVTNGLLYAEALGDDDAIARFEARARRLAFGE